MHEDDPERAVRAALAILDAAREADVQLRVAVNSGEALVNIDARPSEGQGMVAGRRRHHGCPDPVQAKCKSRPFAVGEVVASRQRSGSDVEQAPLAPLIGREGELDALRAALARACREREPQLVTVVGVPGIGKSRLVAELFATVDVDPELIYWRQGPLPAVWRRRQLLGHGRNGEGVGRHSRERLGR